MLRLASYNVNSVRSRTELIGLWLDHRGNDIDILAMQELKATAEQFPGEFFESRGFVCHINPQKRYNGVGICSKFPPDDVQIRFNRPVLDAQARIIRARFGRLDVWNIYGPHGDLPGTDKFRFKMQWYDQLTDLLKTSYDLETDRVIITGDFNITFDDRDVYDPIALAGSIGTMPQERAKLQALLELGFIDGFRHLHPDTIQYTWWDYQGAKIWKNQGMRIDHLLVSPAALPFLREVEVDLWPRRKNKIKPSDHAPLIGAFDKGILS